MLGFFAKYGVLRAALDAHMTLLALAGAIASVIGAFYYLRIVYFMYFGQEGEALDSRMPAPQWILLMASAAAMIFGVINVFGIEGAAAVAAEVLVH